MVFGTSYVQEAVEQLYRFNTHYFEDHDVECAGRKERDVRDKMQQTIAVLDSLQGKLPVYVCGSGI